MHHAEAWACLCGLAPERTPSRPIDTPTRTPRVEVLEGRKLFAVINFDQDGLGANTSPGQVIDNEYAALGVAVSTLNAASPAMIFNSANPTGGDTDLGTANETFGGPGIGDGGELGQPGANSVAQGRVLIISEDGDSSDPDDDAGGGTIVFTFAQDVTIQNIGLLDIENTASRVRTFGEGGNLLSTTAMADLGNNSAQTLTINTSGVRRVEVFFSESGAIPFFAFTNDEPPPPPPPGNEGLTPGFWKNHTSAWQGFSPNQTLESVFDVPDALGLDNTTLLNALQGGGGSGVLGAAKILLRSAVAALLNASHSSVEYPLSAADVIADVNTALATNNRNIILDLATDLDEFNNLGADL